MEHTESPAEAAWRAAKREAKEHPDTSGETPLVSICCITYNHSAYLRETLDGFFAQKVNFPIEILIHDDASTDGTQEIIREYAAAHPGVIRPILREENQYSKGISNISVFNFPRVRGTYVAMCEGDDAWTNPDKLQMQVDYLRQHPDCALCIHSAKIVSVDGSKTAGRMRPYRSDRDISSQEIVDKTCGYPTASMVFPARIIRKLPRYYLECPVGDIPMQLMMACEGYAHYIDRDMSIYRVGVASSWTNLMKQGDYEAKQRRYAEQMKEMYQAFDKESDKRFHKEAVSAAKRIWYLTQVNTKHYEVVLDRAYRRFYRELDARTRFFIRFEAAMPWAYRLLWKLVRGRS